MIRIHIQNTKQDQHSEHESGPLEIGRGPKRQLQRVVVDDAFFSRDQLRVEERPSGLVYFENLSNKNPVVLSNGSSLAPGANIELELPLVVTLGKTRLEFDRLAGEDPLEAKSLMTVSQPILGRSDTSSFSSLNALGDSPAPERLANWMETIISLQRSALGSVDLYEQSARAMVELIGLDQGFVLLRENNDWKIASSFEAEGLRRATFSRTLLEHVVTQRQTFFRDVGAFTHQTINLADVAAVVVSPIFGMKDEVVGALYGLRSHRALTRVGPIKPLEAQVVQLLASAVGAHLTRALAARTRIQFEQFFSPELARELERDPGMLEGRNQEVTILLSDIRGSSSLAQRLGPQDGCQLVRDMMERLSAPIVEQGGVIVDYAGDGILAMWNAPALQTDHAVRACRAALAMLDEMPGLSDHWRDKVGDDLRIGIGINTGDAQVGNTGSSRKFKYGPNGHTVNLAARVEDATKRLGLPLLISGSTRVQLPEPFATRRLGQFRLAGISDPVQLYELHDESAPDSWTARRDIYEKGLDLYEAGQWARACQTLIQLLDPGDSVQHFDTPTLRLMRQAWQCLESPPQQFQPVIEIEGTR